MTESGPAYDTRGERVMRNSIEKRFRLNWNRIFLTIGLLIGSSAIYIGLFRPGGMSFFDEPGSAADWVAAIGTWMIGYGANKFAGNSYQLKLHERREGLLREVDAKIGALRIRTVGLESWMSQVRMARALLESYPFEEATLHQTRETLGEVVNLIKSVPWGVEDFARIDRAAVSEMLDAERNLGHAQAWIAVTTDRISNADDDGLSEPRVGELRSIAGILGDVVNAASKFVAVADHETQAHLDERERIAKRLQRDLDDLLDS